MKKTGAVKFQWNIAFSDINLFDENIYTSLIIIFIYFAAFAINSTFYFLFSLNIHT